MKLSEQTIELLKNFSGINPNIIFRPGQTISTMAEAKNILATATIAETIDKQFGIYELNEIQATIALVDDPELELTGDSIVIRDGKTSIRYFYAAEDLLTSPTKMITMPKAEVKLKLTGEVLAKIRKAAAVFGHSTLAIEGNDGVVSITILDEKNATANKYSITIDESNDCKESFSFVIVIGNLKLLPGDYDVSISSKLISNFKHSELDLSYFIALEKTSTFGK